MRALLYGHKLPVCRAVLSLQHAFICALTAVPCQRSRLSVQCLTQSTNKPAQPQPAQGSKPPVQGVEEMLQPSPFLSVLT